MDSKHISFQITFKTDHGLIDLLICDHHDDGIDKYLFGKTIAIIMNIQLNEGEEYNRGFGQELYLKALITYSTLYSAFLISEEAFHK